ncbi:MAG: hypothetical protein DCC49_13010 [Acidobacteria bacterium]|nr:MAG: hypothetical protein DCC49_13010 [Acidobacteriota bacterium]
MVEMTIVVVLIGAIATGFFVLVFTRLDRRLLQRRFDAWRADELARLDIERAALIEDIDSCSGWCRDRIDDDFAGRGMASSGMRLTERERSDRDHDRQRDAVNASYDRAKNYLDNAGPARGIAPSGPPSLALPHCNTRRELLTRLALDRIELPLREFGAEFLAPLRIEDQSST